ncbi:MAG: hypothetical protein MUF54_01475 [Polyangiaceae bacterium]|jgi:hypothetical protein|nr:hypothetical protein [Polyangiaceae bacterium]
MKSRHWGFLAGVAWAVATQQWLSVPWQLAARVPPGHVLAGFGLLGVGVFAWLEAIRRGRA